MGNETSNTRHATHDGNSPNTNRRNTSNASTSNTPRTNDWDVGSIVVAAGAAAVTVYGVSKLLSALTENTPEHETKTASETANSVWNLQQPRVYDYDDEEDTKQYPSRQINDSCDKEDYKCYPSIAIAAGAVAAAVYAGSILLSTENVPERETKDRQTAREIKDVERCYGWYNCNRCNQEWQSCHSWKNYGQQCRTCNYKGYNKPYRQVSLEKRNGSGPRKPHRQDLCEKCEELGYSCLLG